MKIIHEGFTRRIPATWTCVQCGVTHPYSPAHEMPWGEQLEDVVQPNGDVLRRVVGDFCLKCMVTRLRK